MNNAVPSTQESLASVPSPPAAAAATKTPSLKETLELASKSLIGLAGLCYVTGLVVVTLHLRRYGLNSLSLSQLHYMTAGVWVLLPALMGVFYCVFVKVFYDSAVEQRQQQLLKEQQSKQVKSPGTSPENEDQTLTNASADQAEEPEPSFKRFRRRVQALRRNPKVIAIVWAIFVPAFLFYGAVGKLSDSFGVSLSWRSWLFIPAFGALALGSVSLVAFSVLSGRMKPGDKSFMAVVVFGGLGAFLFLLYISFFSIYTYEEIPWSTGGGRPSQVRFMVANDDKTLLENAGVKFGTIENQTEPLKLLLATETEYVIITPDGKAISVPSSSVKSVVYEK